MILSMFFTIVGLALIIFNKQIVRIESKLQKKNFDAVKYNLVKTQFYILGAVAVVIGVLFYLWNNSHR